jgi:hypothetical protein
MHMATTTSRGAISRRQAQGDSLDPQTSNQQQRTANASPKGRKAPERKGIESINKSMNSPHAGQSKNLTWGNMLPLGLTRDATIGSQSPSTEHARN